MAHLKHNRTRRLTPHLMLLLGANACVTIGDPDRAAYRPPSSTAADARLRPFAGPKVPAALNYPSNSPKESPANWQAILTQRSRIRFEVLHTGRVRVPRSGMLNLAHAKLSTADGSPATDSEMFVDVFAFRFCHKSAGCFLIDSGLDSSFRPETGGNISGAFADEYIRATEQSPGQDIAAQLEAPERASLAWPGQSPALQGVFFTHLHGDHTSGVPALPKDIRYIAGKNEAYINYFLLYYSDHLTGVRELEEIDFDGARFIAPLGPAVYLFSDGSAWAIATPGHSSGHVSYLLMTTDGPVLLTGDASHTRWGFENGVEPGWHANRPQMQASLRQLIAFARAYPRVRVIYGHER